MQSEKHRLCRFKKMTTIQAVELHSHDRSYTRARWSIVRKKNRYLWNRVARRRSLVTAKIRETSLLLRTCGRRICAVWHGKTRLLAGNDFGPVFGEASSGHLVPCTRPQGRSADMQEFPGNTPGLSLFDRELFLLGWDRGAEWQSAHPHQCNPGSCNRLSLSCFCITPCSHKSLL